MPWRITSNDRGCPETHPWGVRVEATNELIACHTSHTSAIAQVAALHAAEALTDQAIEVWRSLDDLDLTPTAGMVEEAQRGLDWRDEHNRGGTAVGIARARDIVNRSRLSPETVLRMHSFFARHEVDKQGQGFTPGEDGYPSNGRIAWALWGGDPGQTWAAANAERIRAIREENA